MFFSRRISSAFVAAVLVAAGCATAVAQELAVPADAASDLPFKRSLGVKGVVSGSLEESVRATGVPVMTVAELLLALAEAIDLGRDIHDGDRFYVRYERTFSLDDTPLDGGHVLWAELQLAGKKSAIALHRFRPPGASHDSLWFADWQAAVAPTLRLPLSGYVLSSGFGLRVDPLDQPPLVALGIGPSGGLPLGKGPTRVALPPGLVSRPGGGGLSFTTATPPAASSPGATPAARGVMALHEGVDLVAPYGAPIFASGDGIVKGAEPKGRYGNWIEIDHPADLATVYGHLSSFAPGIAAGTPVTQGQLIGYIGLTGRTTGPHVHFEVRFKGRPVNPMVYSALKHPQLRGPDLDRLRKLVVRNLAERERETKAALAGL